MWKTIIDELGIQKVADAIARKTGKTCSQVSVWKWVNGKTLPDGDNRKALVEYMRETLSEDRFKVFINSFQVEIFGFVPGSSTGSASTVQDNSSKG